MGDHLAFSGLLQAPWTLSKQMFRGGRQIFQVGQAPPPAHRNSTAAYTYTFRENDRSDKWTVIVILCPAFVIKSQNLKKTKKKEISFVKNLVLSALKFIRRMMDAVQATSVCYWIRRCHRAYELQIHSLQSFSC